MQIYNKLQITSLMLVIYFNGFFLFTGISRSDTIHVNRWSEESPYKTVSEGVETAEPGDVLSILGTYYYPERLVISKRLTLTANGGAVTIGECKQVARPGDLIKRQDAHFIVNNKETLLSALHRAKPGNIIYIRDEANINLNGEKNIIISEGVTLASGRGYKLEEGALLSFYEDLGEFLFKIEGSNVRITGIRFRGPDVSFDASRIAGCLIFQGDYENLEIDHNEFYGWPIAAVEIRDNPTGRCSLSTVYIHDNYFHHNLGYKMHWYWSYSFGYGVVLSSAYALIEKNVFDQNRHAIAGSGEYNEGYEARWNVVLDKNDCCERLITSGSHSFDMHRQDEDNQTGPAGEYIMIRENTFLYEGREGVTIRGKPTEGAFVLDNTFIQPRSTWRLGKSAVRQENEYGNLVEQNNQYEVNHQHELAFGDFDGDGATDVFWADGRNWWVSSSGKMVWTHLNSYPTVLTDLAFGDFDGNDTTDVFTTLYGKWHVSWNGTSQWQVLRSSLDISSLELKNLAFGDFDGNGKTDVFRTDPGRREWLVSFDGTGDWKRINTSDIGLKDLAFGDFDGNGKTDVFRTKTGEKLWLVSWNGTSKWDTLNTRYDNSLKDLAFGNFNDDHRTDIFRTDSGEKKWYVSYGGTRSWQALNDKIKASLENLNFGDFDKDGITDVFMRRENTTEWLISWRGITDWKWLNPSFSWR